MARLVAGLALLLLGPAGVRAADFEVECRLCAGDPSGSREAGTIGVIAAPKLVMKSGEASTLLVGGHLLIGGQFVPVGREVGMTATRADDGAIRVRAVLKVHSSTGGAVPQVNTSSEEAVATIQPGEVVRVELGRDPKNRLWADLTVRPVK